MKDNREENHDSKELDSYEDFIERLKAYGVTVKWFSTMSSTSYNTIMSWSKRGKIPTWVNSWLNLYDTKLKYKNLLDKVDRIKFTLKDIMSLDSHPSTSRTHTKKHYPKK